MRVLLRVLSSGHQAVHRLPALVCPAQVQLRRVAITYLSPPPPAPGNHSSPLFCVTICDSTLQVRPQRICPASAYLTEYNVLDRGPSMLLQMAGCPCFKTKQYPMYVYTMFLYPFVISIFKNCKTFYSYSKHFWVPFPVCKALPRLWEEPWIDWQLSWNYCNLEAKIRLVANTEVEGSVWLVLRGIF